MKKAILLIVLVCFAIGCQNKKSSNQRILSDSSGNINNLSVIIENDLWQGNVGEAIRNVLASPVDGLPQDEPLFSMSQLPPQVFTGFATHNRTVLKIEKGKTSNFTIARNVFAKPQKVVVVSGETNTEIIDLINQNSKKIIQAFKDEEIKEKQRRINLSLFDDKPIQDELGLSLKFPTAYRIAKHEDKFFWIRKDITTGTTNLLLYELPLNSIKRNDSLMSRIIKVRDSIGKAHIPGPTEGTYLITEQAYAPFQFETIIDNKPTIETKGNWEVHNAFMAGPFINYVIEDKTNNRLVVIEGFAFAPSVEKREYMFELEAIIKSIEIQ
ncbi:MAG TPA: DUF4837 family protein [Flavobacteriaceae bacterium]|nr:DUF4837 family protein [Flavobacteriaceae bacterium]